MPVRALQAGRSDRFLAAQCGEGLGQWVQRAAHHLHVVRMPQVRCQGDLGRLVLQITPQMGAAQPSAQALLGDREGLLDDIVGAVDDGHQPASRIAGDGLEWLRFRRPTRWLVSAGVLSERMLEHRGWKTGSVLACTSPFPRLLTPNPPLPMVVADAG